MGSSRDERAVQAPKASASIERLAKEASMQMTLATLAVDQLKKKAVPSNDLVIKTLNVLTKILVGLGRRIASVLQQENIQINVTQLVKAAQAAENMQDSFSKFYQGEELIFPKNLIALAEAALDIAKSNSENQILMENGFGMLLSPISNLANIAKALMMQPMQALVASSMWTAQQPSPSSPDSVTAVSPATHSVAGGSPTSPAFAPLSLGAPAIPVKRS